MNTYCEWHEDLEGNWETDCGNKFVFVDRGPIDNGMRYCPFCGHRLQEVKYVEEDEV
jgi:hypothetical protein